MSSKAADALAVFHPLIDRWFRDGVGEPTDVQRQAWPKIAAGEHVLISAPTGSGKTLTAFLWALHQLFTGRWTSGRVRVLYVSPLRALNTDIRRNLELPLAALGERFRDAGEVTPGIRVMTRSGDTPPAQRQKMLRRPPEILITTPESLNILLTSKGGRSLLTGLETVILDEIHAVAATKRGTHLITAVDRLVPLSGEFQRIALSATIRPMAAIADFVGGYEMRETEGGVRYVKRRVARVRSSATKRYHVSIRHPAAKSDLETTDSPRREADGSSPLWEQLVGDFQQVIRRNRSTLLFANSRRMTEKVTRLINAEAGTELAYSHHGSLSREVRAVVEKRLKGGELKAIVATNSLELGIDIGALDEVILIQSPRAISAAIQRIGRAGHGVGEVSRGVFYPTHGRDFLDAAIIAKSIHDQDIEEVTPIVAPLDVLAQVILSMVVAEPWNVDELFLALRTSYPYRHLKRRQLGLVVDMLTGRYADSRIRELRPRASFDRIDNTLKARRGVARTLYMSGGTIADRGYFNLRLEDSMAKLGELDEEFVWERSTGDTFTLGAQSWQIRKVTHNDVLVVPARRGSALAPFWRADAQDREFFLANKAASFLERVEERLQDPGLPAELCKTHHLESPAADELVAFLASQKAATGQLPHAHRLVFEHCGQGLGDDRREQVILHTFWGGTVNRPLVIALEAAWDERYEEPFEAFQDDDCLLLRLPRGFEAREILRLVDPDQLETLLRRRLEQTGFFGARFRVNASTALLLPRSGFRHRTPLWMHRQKSKKLLEAVAPYGDFPVLVETWRTCLQDEFDLKSLRTVLRQVEEGEIDVQEVRTESPSPFAANLMWQHTNHFMYADDSPENAQVSNLRQDLLKELVFQSHLRPRLPRQLVEEFCGKAQRTAVGYAPRPGDDLLDWMRERILVPKEEWRRLVAAVKRDHDATAEAILSSVSHRVVTLEMPGAATRSVATLDSVPRLLRVLDLELDELGLASIGEGEGDDGDVTAEALGALQRLLAEGPSSAGADESEEEENGLAPLLVEWMAFYGPFEPQRLREVFGLGNSVSKPILEVLQESQQVVLDQLTRDSPAVEVCDAENLETLLRWLRVALRPSFEALEADSLPLFMALHQGVADRGDNVEDLQDRLEKLFGYVAPAAMWESEILPARLDPYYPSWLDSLMQESELRWLGCGNGKLMFLFPSDLELFLEPSGAAETPGNLSGGVEPEAAVESCPESVAESAAEPIAEAVRRSVSGPTPGEISVTREVLFPASRGKRSSPDPAAPGQAALSGKADLFELSERTGCPTAVISEALWRLAWQGEVANDSFLAVRKGIESRFQLAEAAVQSRRGRPRGRRRASFDRWKTSRAAFGNWFVIDFPQPPQDALDSGELVKDRIRVLLQRYGILFRELLVRELSALRWSRVFRELRLMELSGEVLAGHFFAGVQGLQFMSHAGFRELQRGLPQDSVYWLSAADPASLAGVPVEGLKGELPSRLVSNHMVYHGRKLVLISKRRGRELEIRCTVEHPHLPQVFEVLKNLLTREFQPLKAIDVETINGEPATASPYADGLRQIFRVTREPQSLKLWKQY